MTTPQTQTDKPKGPQIGRIIVIFGAVGVAALVFMGARQLIGAISIVKTPLVGEWRAANKPWRIDFLPDKKIVSSTGALQSNGAQTWTSASGAYSLDYFGTLWVELENGKRYTATLTAESPNRFDLIDSQSEGVTVFERAPPTPPDLSKALPK